MFEVGDKVQVNNTLLTRHGKIGTVAKAVNNERLEVYFDDEKASGRYYVDNLKLVEGKDAENVKNELDSERLESKNEENKPTGKVENCHIGGYDFCVGDIVGVLVTTDTVAYIKRGKIVETFPKYCNIKFDYESGEQGYGYHEIFHMQDAVYRGNLDKDKAAKKLDEAAKIMCTEVKGEDMVNHPPHYNAGKVECIDAIEAATGSLTGIEAVCTGNAIKYLWRWKLKGGKQDLEKAQWYLQKLIDNLNKQEGAEK